MNSKVVSILNHPTSSLTKGSILKQDFKEALKAWRRSAWERLSPSSSSWSTRSFKLAKSHPGIGEISPPPSEGAVITQGGTAAERIDLLEARIQNLETMLKSVDKRLNSLMNVRDEKDAVVLELFKLLKSSMESRYDTLLNVARIKAKN
ncbi:DUF5320 domain-containing protein [Desulfatitalea tepidiphila]|uniref:DUF5320 domain-containing protein n=1 Tax=Desulfatitalea tepidiphila TaxID=1185843 RepID=UPI00128FB9CF|nr:DUF5320 domain-containing protein [Desulfatitalea tepidiphila]